MHQFESKREIFGVLVVLSITQIIGWGTIGLPAIIGIDVARDLGMSISLVFAGSSILYVVMGLCTPLLAKIYVRFGARRIMITGTLVAVPGFVGLALANGPVLYLSAWIVLGLAGSATLTTPAYILLNGIAGRNAKGAIGGLMLVTGLSSSIFWPLTSVLSASFGWRETCLIYAAALIVISLPLYILGLPRHAVPTEAAGSPSMHQDDPAQAVGRVTFYLIVAAITLNSLVTIGFASILIELLKATGLPATEAIAFGSGLGVIQVSARAVDFLGGRRWGGISTGLFAGIALPVSMCWLMLGGGTFWSIAGFILVYGLGSGALAVARATIPLVFYDKADYALAASRIALPLNLMSAIAPPVLAGLLANFGSGALLGLAILCSCGALVCLGLLSRRRPQAAMAQTKKGRHEADPLQKRAIKKNY